MYSNWPDFAPPEYWLERLSIISNIVAICIGIVVFVILRWLYESSIAETTPKYEEPKKEDEDRIAVARTVGFTVAVFTGFGAFKFYLALLEILPRFAPMTDTMSWGDLVWLIVVGFAILCQMLLVVGIHYWMDGKFWKHAKNFRLIGNLATFIASIPAGVVVAILVSIIGVQLTNVLSGAAGLLIVFLIIAGINAIVESYHNSF